VKTSRNGFTLIELLLVLVIVGILASFVMPAVFNALSSVQTSTVAIEIRSLDTGVNTFKLMFGVEPPSSVSIYTTQAGWDSDPSSKAVIRRMWPQFDFSMPAGSFPPQWSYHPVNGSLRLTPSECLVFFLGGVIPDGSPPSGFSANPSRPFSPNGASRIPPFYQFDFGRLTDVDNNGIPEYCDTLPGLAKKPYLYFSSYEGTGYRVSELPTLPGIYFSDVYRQSSASGIVPGNATFSLPAHNHQSFQIISPGHDGEYGSGGVYNPDLPDGGLIGLDGKTDRDAFDNITNFSRGRLVK
jgi:prepilin-type N-terminal cleavage/methylation domain-containing protein